MIIKKEESTDYTVVSAIFYFTQQSGTVHCPVSTVQCPESTGQKFTNKISIYLSFILAGIFRIRETVPDPTGSESAKLVEKMHSLSFLLTVVYCIGQSLEWKVLRAILQNHFGLVYKQPELRKIRIRIQVFAARIQILKLANCKITF